MASNLESVYLRLCYTLRKSKFNNNSAIVLGAGCSLGSTPKDISTVGIMKECLMEHGFTDVHDCGWEKLYQNFTNIVWQGKTNKEREMLLGEKLSGIEPSDGHRYLRNIIVNGYISTVITTNFDMLLEKAFEGLSYIKRVGDDEYTTIGNSPTFSLIKVHGDIECGKLRFAPHELTKLPESLHKDIFEKTSGVVLFAGYRGQDIGLMHSISSSNDCSAYWIDINEISITDAFTTKHIFEFMAKRESSGNFLHGKEFGDFQKIMTKMESLLVSQPQNLLIESKEVSLSNVWKDTSIVESLTIYSRMYELFLDIINISDAIQKKMIWKSGYPAYSNSYDESLQSYLYFFKSKNLPPNLVHIPNNEVDALVLGISIEVLVRTVGNDIPAKEYIDNIRTEFEGGNYETIITTDSFWEAIEKAVCPDVGMNNEINLYMGNNLILKSYDTPLREFNEFLRIIQFLSLLVPTSKINSDGNDSRCRIRQFLNGKYENTLFSNGKLTIDLGKISAGDVDSLITLYVRNLPDINEFYGTESSSAKRVTFTSKWLEINIEIALPDDEDIGNNTMALFPLIKKRGQSTTQRYLNSGDAFNRQLNKHVELEFDKEIGLFLKTNNVAMFVSGSSGSGKTSAIKHFLFKNKETKDIISIVVTPKLFSIEKYGLALFLDLDLKNNDANTLLRHVNESLALRNTFLVLVFDGLNEINDVIEKQRAHYCCLLELAEMIHRNSCTHIKLIITCRENAYHKLKNSSGLYLNPLYFYSGINLETVAFDDACYKIMMLSDEAKRELILNYTSGENQGNEPDNSLDVLDTSDIFSDDMPPLFIAVAAEALRTASGVSAIKRGDTIYDLFSNTILARIEKENVFTAKKIMFAYFDLITNYRRTDIEVTRFKIIECFAVQDHARIDETIDKMTDTNIFIHDYPENKRVKFQHDRIEEFFYMEYIEEYEYKGLPFFNDALEMADKNVVYRSGLLQYFQRLIKKKKLNTLKNLAIELFGDHIEILPGLVVEALSYSQDLRHNLEYLLNANDAENSVKFLNLLIRGLDDGLQDFSAITYDLVSLVEEMHSMTVNDIITDGILASVCYFKSKIHYFTNNYEMAQMLSNESVALANGANQILSTKININLSVILMELGLSKNAIELLEKEFDFYHNNNDFNMLCEIGVELGRVLSHSGQIEKPLEIYDFLLTNIGKIANTYVLARIYEQKANVLNEIMYSKLQYGFLTREHLTLEVLDEVNALFEEAIVLYDKSMHLLLKTNAIFTYSGVVPEKINTYVSYSYSVRSVGIDECVKMIDETDNLFKKLSTPFKTDFYLCKAYYYEYKRDIENAETYHAKALRNALTMNNRNKVALCRNFYGQFIYRRIIFDYTSEDKGVLVALGLAAANEAIKYYKEYTLVENNTVLASCEELQRKYLAFISQQPPPEAVA